MELPLEEMVEGETDPSDPLLGLLGLEGLLGLLGLEGLGLGLAGVAFAGVTPVVAPAAAAAAAAAPLDANASINKTAIKNNVKRLATKRKAWFLIFIFFPQDRVFFCLLVMQDEIKKLQHHPHYKRLLFPRNHPKGRPWQIQASGRCHYCGGDYKDILTYVKPVAYDDMKDVYTVSGRFC